MDVKFRGILIKRSPEEPSILHGGWLKIQPSNPDYAQLLINKLAKYKGEELEISVYNPESWSYLSNRLFHALVRDIMIADAVQYWQLLGRAPQGFDEIKEWCKVNFGGAEVKIVGSLSFIKSWSDFTKKEASQTIDYMIDYCLEQGVEIDERVLERNNLRGVKNELDV